MIYLLLAGAYLLGSIPFGLVLTRSFSVGDPRKHGSGNIGATNVARVGGLGLGLATLAADMLKGLVPVLLSLLVLAPGDARSGPYPVAIALMAFFGHLFPVYTRFRSGGKGVATAFGGFVLIAPMAVLAAITVLVIFACLSRRISVGSIAATIVLPLAVYSSVGTWATSAGAALASVFIFIRHADNLKRLIAGTEPVFQIGRNKA